MRADNPEGWASSGTVGNARAAGRVTVFGAATEALCVDREARRIVETLPSAGRLVNEPLGALTSRVADRRPASLDHLFRAENLHGDGV